MSAPPGSVRLRLLGPIDCVRVGSGSLAFRDRKSLALLVRLALADGTPLYREALAELLWPELPDSRGRRNLRVTLARLNRTFGASEPPWFLADRRSVRCNPTAPLHCDAIELERLARQWRRHAHRSLARCTACEAALARAATLSAGAFLDGFHLDGCEAFEDWQTAMRELLHCASLEALDALADRYLESTEFGEAERCTRRELALDPFREKAHRRLMRLLALQDRRSAALAHYASLSERLRLELGVAPDDETTTLHARIEHGEIEAVVLDEVWPSEPRSVPTNLPRESSVYIGHETVRQRLAAHLATERLITLTGIGGIGKTRLALQLAREVLDRFQDGVFLVRLAPLQEPAGIVFAIASAVGFRLGPRGDPTAQLLAHLATQRLLLVLDNFEHLIDGGAGFVTEILRGTSDLRLLVTSRHKLGIAGEAGYTVPELRFAAGEPSVAAVDEPPSEASRLFLDTARRVRLDFAPGTDDLVHIERIGGLVGGHPLALVLAAGWLDILSCREIADELAEGIELLETDRRDGPERQRSVEATFEHSWKLLEEDERTALAAMSVFFGGFDRAAASVVTGVPLRLLGRLVTKSLVHFDAEHERYELHELMRQFAAEKLRRSDATAEIALRHAQHYLGLVDATDLPDECRQGALRRLEPDLDNIRSAWLHTLGERDIARLEASVAPLRMLCALAGREYDLIGMLEPVLSLVRQPLDAAMGTSATCDREWRRSFELDLLLALGVAYRSTRGYSEPALSPLFERAWELVVEVEDSAELFAVLYGLWSFNFVQARLERASAITAEWRRRLDAAEARGDASDYLHDARFIVHCLEGPVHYIRGECTSAIAVLESGLALEREDRRDAVIAIYGLDFAVSGHHWLAVARCHAGHLDSGLAAARRARDIAREGGQPLVLSFAAFSLTSVSALRRDTVATLRHAASLRAILAEHRVAVVPTEQAAFLEGFALADNDVDSGIAQMSETIDAPTHLSIHEEFHACLLADRLLGAGRVDEALARLARLRAAAEASGVASFHAESVRLTGVGHRLRGETDAAREHFERALGIARKQGALLFELRAAASLVSLDANTEVNGSSAHALLEQVLARFTDSVEIADLAAARALLAGSDAPARAALRAVR